MSGSRRWWPRALRRVGIGVGILVASRAEAQGGPLVVTARTGIAGISDAYQSNCGHASIGTALDVQGRGRIFPQASFEHFSGAGGGDVLCLPADPALATGVGGLRLEGANRVSVGAGARLGSGLLQLEGVVMGGALIGAPGYRDEARDSGRRIAPQVGGQGSLVLLRYVLFSVGVYSTRLSLDLKPTNGGASTIRSEWSPMSTWQVGVRFGRSRGF